MQEISAQILKKRIISSNIYISQKVSKKLDLDMKCQIEIKTSKKQEDKTVLLNIKLNIDSKDEKIKIELIGKIIFTLSELPDDYTKIAEKTLVPIARDSLLNSLDDILVDMGYSKMELAKKM